MHSWNIVLKQGLYTALYLLFPNVVYYIRLYVVGVLLWRPRGFKIKQIESEVKIINIQTDKTYEVKKWVYTLLTILAAVGKAALVQSQFTKQHSW